MSNHDIPVISIQGETLADTYEKALIALHERGIRINTQYDKPGDPASIDSTMDLTILRPWDDPMIHKAFPGGIEDLREYVFELTGAKDHWVKNANDSADTRWEYTYHGRLSNYGQWRELQNGNSVETGPFKVDQFRYVVEKLAKQPFTRQAQMITWMPSLDLDCYDPPCLQSLWYRIVEDEAGVWWLNCNVRFRSNDAWGASFMNMFGFIQMNRQLIADPVAKLSGRRVELGRMNWHADSYHIYGKDIAAAQSMLFERLSSMPFEERVYNFHDDFIQEMYHDCEAGLINKIRNYDPVRR